MSDEIGDGPFPVPLRARSAGDPLGYVVVQEVTWEWFDWVAGGGGPCPGCGARSRAYDSEWSGGIPELVTEHASGCSVYGEGVTIMHYPDAATKGFRDPRPRPEDEERAEREGG